MADFSRAREQALSGSSREDEKPIAGDRFWPAACIREAAHRESRSGKSKKRIVRSFSRSRETKRIDPASPFHSFLQRIGGSISLGEASRNFGAVET